MFGLQILVPSVKTEQQFLTGTDRRDDDSVSRTALRSEVLQSFSRTQVNHAAHGLSTNRLTYIPETTNFLELNPAALQTQRDYY